MHYIDYLHVSVYFCFCSVFSSQKALLLSRQSMDLNLLPLIPLGLKLAHASTAAARGQWLKSPPSQLHPPSSLLPIYRTWPQEMLLFSGMLLRNPMALWEGNCSDIICYGWELTPTHCFSNAHYPVSHFSHFFLCLSFFSFTKGDVCLYITPFLFCTLLIHEIVLIYKTNLKTYVIIFIELQKLIHQGFF